MAYSNLTDNMMDLLTSRLPRSIKVRPHPFVMERMLEVVMKRVQNPKQHPPLRIAVFGGSVTEGFRSRANSIDLSDNQKGFQACAWSHNLERVLNQVLPLFFSEYDQSANDRVPSFPLVEVKNYAVSGTDSSIGATILEYNLLGADMAITDVVISAFGANDLQQPVGLERDLVFSNMQRFHKLVKAQRPCSDLPLLIQIADVFEESLTMGSTLIRKRLRYSSEMLETTNWARIMALSYPDAIRDVIYRDPSDTTLIEYGELHPGMTFHMGVAWMIAYGLLDGALQACDASSLADHNKREPRTGVTFPILDNNLQAQNAPALWKNETRALELNCLENHSAGIACEYQFIAHALGASSADLVKKAVASVATNINGWEATGFPVKKPRRTWQAMRKNATFTIQLDKLIIPINRLLVLYIKSYGIEWESVRLDLVFEGTDNSEGKQWIELKRVELTGFHNSTTSINYSKQVHLGNKLIVGSSVRAIFTLTQGAKFQINGLAFCSAPEGLTAGGAEETKEQTRSN